MGKLPRTLYIYTKLKIYTVIFVINIEHAAAAAAAANDVVCRVVCVVV